MSEKLEKCACVYCAGTCEIRDEYSIEGFFCEECFAEHTYLDEQDEAIYPLRNEVTSA